MTRRASVARQPHLDGIDPGPSARERQASGEAAEEVADAMHKVCAVARVAVVRRVSSHLRLVRGEGGTPRVVPAQRGTVDCLGVLQGGRAVGIEVKSCADGRLALSRLPAHQRAELHAIEQAGGLALVLIVGRPSCWAVPWSVVAAALTAGKASLGPDDLGPWLCDPRRPYLARWLPPASRSAVAPAAPSASAVTR